MASGWHGDGARPAAVVVCASSQFPGPLPPALTHTGPLAEGHERAEDTAHRVGALLNGKAPLQLQGPFIVHHPEEKAKERGQGGRASTSGGQRRSTFWILYLSAHEIQIHFPLQTVLLRCTS